MQHLESAASPTAHPSAARWVRVSAAVVLCLAGRRGHAQDSPSPADHT